MLVLPSLWGSFVTCHRNVVCCHTFLNKLYTYKKLTHSLIGMDNNGAGTVELGMNTFKRTTKMMTADDDGTDHRVALLTFFGIRV